MDKRKKLCAVVELGKDILIVGLICSAIWMLTSGGLMKRLGQREADPSQITGMQHHAAVQEEAVLPLSITATLSQSGEPVRYAALYNPQAVDGLFQETAGLLVETLSSAEDPQKITRREWEQALGRAPGVSFDFRGEMPLSALTGWLKAELGVPDALVRRLLLTAWEDWAALYYQDVTTGIWYRCVTQVVSRAQLENAVAGLSPNGAYYAFESPLTAALEEDTLLLPNPEDLSICAASNPMSGGRGALEVLMTELGFNLSGCVFYSGAGEEVGRSGSDTLRLSKQGVVEYHTDESGQPRFPIQSGSGNSRVYEVVNSCSQLLWQAVHTRCGQARTYLSRVEETQNGWRLEYEYSINGIPIQLKSGPAAVFEVENGSITSFTLRLRSYNTGEQRQIILPPVQAAAAMTALELEGREMMIQYQDRGEERVVPGWTAVSGREE